MHLGRLIIATTLALSIISCSETKFVSDGEYLLDNVDVVVDKKYTDIRPQQMKLYVQQKGNSRWFSNMKVPLATYSMAGKDSTKWINRTLKSMGEEPIIYDSAKTAQSSSDLRLQMQNMGYLRATVDTLTERKGKKIKATYILHPGEPYKIGNIDYLIEDSTINDLLCLDDTINRGLKPSMRFSVQNLDNERKRIAELLINNGFYKFHKDYINYRADSTVGSNAIDITLILHKFRSSNKEISNHPRYRIGDVVFWGNDNRESKPKLRKGVIASNNHIESGDYYSANKLQNTYNRFGRLGAVKYTNIRFNERQDTTLLDCDIQISTNKPNSLSFQPEGTNTAGDLGAAASLTYQNSNLFRGSELFSIELCGAFEAIKGLEGYENHNFEEYSVEGRLAFPTFIAPFISQSLRRRTNATSELSVMYDLQNRPEYHRRVLSLAWRYKWSNLGHNDKYQIDLLNLDYVFMPWISQKFKDDYLSDNSSSNAILRYNYEDIFIMKFGAGYSYNNGKFALKASAETAGNFLGLTSNFINYKKNELGQNIIHKIAYAQYVKADFSYTLNMRLDYNNSLVFHAGFGIAYPYGNSTILPFEKRYFSGGANSVRGWSVRGLGPGRFQGKDGNIDFINQTGDMKLDLNLEYRVKMFWKFNGALFVDAGNIWTLRKYEDQPGGQFQFSHFLEELAVAYGLGIRINFNFFILRFDFGMKAIDPAYTENKRHYPITNPKPSRDLTFHFAVGLPF